VLVRHGLDLQARLDGWGNPYLTPQAGSSTSHARSVRKRNWRNAEVSRYGRTSDGSFHRRHLP
jgi:hypothetical protein